MAIFLVCITALIAGVVNAVAGGGTFLAFPALTGIGRISELSANIACTVGLWPGNASSVVAVRQDLKKLPARLVAGYVCICLIGGAIGSLLLLNTSQKAFQLVIPWLLLFATIIFALGHRVARWAGRGHGRARSLKWTIFVGLIQFLVAIYGGYFGAGIGVLTLAGLSLVGLESLHQTNVLKVVLSTATNLTAAVVFLFGQVPWDFVGPMAIASAVGGVLGIYIARRMPPRLFRGVILTIAVLLTAAYFWIVYVRPHVH
jgi:uncharacterized membrane protein YfcA